MKDESFCPTLRDGDDAIARRWAAGALDAASAREFETHLLTCDRCQRAVEHSATLAASLRSVPSASASRASRNAWLRRWPIPLAIAACAAAVVLWSRDPYRKLAGLGSPPAFTPASIRAEGDSTTEADRGMAAYVRRDFAAASGHLDVASRSSSSTAGLRFFLGVSKLYSGDATGAIAVLGTLANDTAGPYVGEAQFWLAKAWLSRGVPDSAASVLRMLSRRTEDPQLSAHARALTDSIREVRRR